MQNTTIVIGTRTFKTNNDAVINNLTAFISNCLAVGAVTEVQSIGSVSMAGITSATTAEDPQPRQHAEAVDIVCRFEFEPEKRGGHQYYIVRKVIDSKQFPKNEYKSYERNCRKLAGDFVKQNFPYVTINKTYTQKNGVDKSFPMTAVTADVKKQIPAEYKIPAADIAKAQADYDEWLRKSGK